MSRVEDALKLRDIVQSIVDDKLGKDRPRSSTATVTGYNPALGTVSVMYEGDTISVDIPAGSIYPSEVGQIVRIGGPAGSKVIEDVYGETLADVKTRTAQKTADGKNTVNYGTEEPPGTDHAIGDIWFDESNSNLPHIWNGSAWESVADARVDVIKKAQEDLAKDLSDVVANGVGSRTHYTPDQPAVADSKEGDLWFDTSTDGYNEVWVFSGGEWKSVADTRIAAINAAQDTLKTDLNAVKATANAKNRSYYQTTQPTDAVDGDLWFNTSSGKNNELRIYSGGSWKLATDLRVDAIQTAQNDLSTELNTVKTTANGKNSITRSTSNPTSPYTGRVDDLWFVMSTLGSGGRVNSQWRWTGTQWLQETITNAVIATLDAAKITTGTLSAARIAANSLNADTVLVGGSVGSTSIAGGAITTAKIAVGAITAESGVVASLDAGKIVVGTLDAARIAANSITIDKMLMVGDLTNLHADPLFQNPLAAPAGWSVINNGLEKNGTGSQEGGYENYNEVPVQPGDKFYAEMVRTTLAGTTMGTVTFYVQQFDASTNSWGTPIGVLNMSADGKATGSFTIGANISKIRWGYYTQSSMPSATRVRLTAPIVRRMTGSTLIEDGAITTNKIAVGSITAASGIIASIDAGKITVGELDGARIKANSVQANTVLVSGSVGSTLISDGAITTAKLAVGAITAESGVIGSIDASKITVGTLSGARLAADAINGMQIIGATIATATGFPRVQMDTDGLSVYKSSAVRSFFADASTGDLSVVGDFATDVSGRERVYLSNGLWNSIQVLNESGAVVGTVPGSGARVGSSDKDSIDLYHASSVTANNITVNSGMLMGPKPSGNARGAMLQLARSTPTSGSQWTYGAIYAFDANNAIASSITATGWSERFVEMKSVNASGDKLATVKTLIQPSSGKGAVYIRGSRNITLETEEFTGVQGGILFNAPGTYPFTFNGGDANLLSIIDFQSRGNTYAQLSYSKVSGGASLTTTDASTNSTIGNAYLELVGGYSGGGSTPTITLTPGPNTVVASAGNVRPLDIRYTGTSATWGVSFRKESTEWGQVGSPSGTSANDFGIVSAAGKDLFLSTVSKSSSLRLKGGTTGKADFLMTADGWNWAGAPTASATANVNITSGGWIQKTSSSRRYKIMEKPLLDLDPDMSRKLLEIEPKSWFDKASADRWAEIDSMKADGEWTEEMEDSYIPDPLTRIPGVIAEDLDEVGLDVFVEYNSDGAPESVLYDRLGVALIPVVRELRDRVDELEAKLAAPDTP